MTYVYNYEDKMVGMNLPGGTSIVYSYDHEGKRISKTAGGATIDYYFDGDYVIMEAQGASVMVYYTQGQGLISQRRGSSFYFYHYDGLDSTKALTDANQNSQASYSYDAWGNILQTNGTIINPYLYAEDNPILYVDPSGYLAQLPGFANLYCDLYALKLLREWDKLRRKYGYYDKYVHCVFSCQLAQECGDAYAECIGALVEIVQKISFGLLGRCDPADLEADKRGIDCGMHQKAECVDCCISKGYRPFPHTPRPIKRPNPKPSYPKPAKSPKPIKR